MTIHPPEPAFDAMTWDVTADMRTPGSGWDEDNYGYSIMVEKLAYAAGLTFEAAPETSCSYFYCDDEATAVAIEAIVRQVMTEAHGPKKEVG